MPLSFKPGFPKRFLKWRIHKDTDPTTLHSIHAGISPVNMPVLALAAGGSTPHDSSTSSSIDASILYQANQVVQYGLNVASPIVGAVPIAGGPLKGAIDALNLNMISEYLKGLPVASLLRSDEVAQAISRCIREIDEHAQDFMVISLIQAQGQVKALTAQLPPSIKHETVFIMDATGREYKLLIDQCQSREQFMTVLGSYYKNTEKDRVMRYYIDRGEYDLYVQGQTGPSEVIGWSGVEGGSRIVMSIRSEGFRREKKYECPQ
ncbi:hypothetical protein H0H87_008800, partial [Tephrocybe sp. NHM501043]